MLDDAGLQMHSAERAAIRPAPPASLDTMAPELELAGHPPSCVLWASSTRLAVGWHWVVPLVVPSSLWSVQASQCLWS